MFRTRAPLVCAPWFAGVPRATTFGMLGVPLGTAVGQMGRTFKMTGRASGTNAAANGQRHVFMGDFR